MIEWARTLLDDRAKDCLAVLVPNGAVLAAVNLTHLNQVVQIAAGALTIGYAVWRWQRDSFVLCQACREGHPPAVCPLSRKKRPDWCPTNSSNESED